MLDDAWSANVDRYVLCVSSFILPSFPCVILPFLSEILFVSPFTGLVTKESCLHRPLQHFQLPAGARARVILSTSQGRRGEAGGHVTGSDVLIYHYLSGCSGFEAELDIKKMEGGE